jgi:hypothetical protein
MKLRNRIQLLEPKSFTSNVPFMACLLTYQYLIPENIPCAALSGFTTSGCNMQELR